MSSPSEQPETTLDEQLVAYLDGELDEPTRRAIETQVAADPKLQARLAALRRAWDLLGELEPPEVGRTFTETTLERVALAAEDEVRRSTDEAPRRRRRQATVLGAAVLAAAALGFCGVAVLRPDPDQALLENLPVVEHLDQYHWVDDLAFLRELDKTGLFAEDPSDEP